MLPPQEGQGYVALVRATRDQELDAWKRFDVFRPVDLGAPEKAAIESRWVLT